MSAARRLNAGGSVAISAIVLLVTLLALPILALVARGGATGLHDLGVDAELRHALALTAATATGATLVAVVLGTPLAYFLARDRVILGNFVRALVELPLMIPHPVAGIALLLAFGRSSVLGHGLAQLGVGIVNSPIGIALAMLFVSAPLYVSAAEQAIARVDVRFEDVARTLGDSGWDAVRRVTLPLAARGLVSGAVVMWARAASEFGAIVILTYNPKVASVLSYDRFTALGLDGALPVAAVLVVLAIVPLVALRALRPAVTGRTRAS